MAKKLDSYKSYGQKLIGLLVRLMFSGERGNKGDGSIFRLVVCKHFCRASPILQMH